MAAAGRDWVEEREKDFWGGTGARPEIRKAHSSIFGCHPGGSEPGRGLDRPPGGRLSDSGKGRQGLPGARETIRNHKRVRGREEDSIGDRAKGMRKKQRPRVQAKIFHLAPVLFIFKPAAGLPNDHGGMGSPPLDLRDKLGKVQLLVGAGIEMDGEEKIRLKQEGRVSRLPISLVVFSTNGQNRHLGAV